MSDISANIVVSSPSNLFTKLNSFNPVSNGMIFIGKIDTDPVQVENRIQVYLESEDGSHIPVEQPLIINAGGYPVYNGQLAKFVTVEGHSMAIYNASGVQEFYYSNVLKYDPDQLQLILASDIGANYVGIKKLGLPNNVPTTIGSFYQAAPINAATDYGLKADFDPTTGVANGTNNRAALQQLMDDLVAIGGNRVVVIPAGNYYFNFDGSTNPGGVGIMWGRVGAGLKNVTFLCRGAVFYSGTPGRMNGVFSANYGVKVVGLRAMGFGGGVLSPSRERDAIFAFAYNCNGVSFEECYLANSMGDCVYLGGSLENGAITGLFCRDISFNKCTLKERYGNGTRSYYGGSRSRLSIAVIDCVGLTISNCTIVGGIDFEPNASSQRLQNYTLNDIRFHSGNVLPYVGSNPFYEEPINSGTQVIRGDIRFQTVAGGVISQNIKISDIHFDYGCIRQTSLAMHDVVWSNIRMRIGIIIVGHDSGTNNNQGARFNDIDIDLALNGSDDDIFELKGSGTTPPSIPSVAVMIQGNITYSKFNNITAGRDPDAFSYVFYVDPAHTAGDSGRNEFIDCNISGGGSLYNFTLSANSQEIGCTKMPSTGVAITKYKRITSEVSLLSVTPLSITASGSVDWSLFRSNKVALTASSAGLLVSGISNSPQIGAEVQIRNSGTNSITLSHSENFYLKGSVNAILDNTKKVLTLQYIEANVWTEIYRNF